MWQTTCYFFREFKELTIKHYYIFPALNLESFQLHTISESEKKYPKLIYGDNSSLIEPAPLLDWLTHLSNFNTIVSTNFKEAAVEFMQNRYLTVSGTKWAF